MSTHSARPADHIGLKANNLLLRRVGAQRFPHAIELMREATRNLRTEVIKKPSQG